MKILRQSAIIAAVCAVAELIKYLLPLPIPASVYGLILMLLALLTGLIKPEQISTVADFFISIMPVLFIAPTVALITQPEHLAVMGGPVVLLGILGTTLVIGISGKAAQAVGRQEAKRREGKSMNDYIAFSAYFGAALTLIIYVVSFRISDRIGHPLANPILICLALLIGALLIFDIDYDAYNQSARYITYLLTPATACLALPLYRQIQNCGSTLGHCGRYPDRSGGERPVRTGRGAGVPAGALRLCNADPQIGNGGGGHAAGRGAGWYRRHYHGGHLHHRYLWEHPGAAGATVVPCD